MSTAKDLIKKSLHFRTYLKAAIKERHNSLNKFCTNSPYDYSDLHKFLNGERDWGVAKVLRLVEMLDLQLGIAPIKKQNSPAPKGTEDSTEDLAENSQDTENSQDINDADTNFEPINIA